jgi:Leucine rich repeat
LPTLFSEVAGQTGKNLPVLATRLSSMREIKNDRWCNLKTNRYTGLVFIVAILFSLVLSVCGDIDIDSDPNDDLFEKCAALIPNPKEIEIPDRNLLWFLKDALKVGSERALTDRDLCRLVEFSIYDENVEEITGLEYAIHLRGFGLTSTPVSDITPLSGLGNIESLALDINRITDPSTLAGMQKLKRLSLIRNDIEDISELTDLPMLSSLYIGQNRISDISPLAEFANLESLWAEENNIENIFPLRNLSKLELLLLGSNNISDISPLATSNSLTEIQLYCNPISDVSPFFDMDLGDRKVTIFLDESTYLNMPDDIDALASMGIDIRHYWSRCPQ